MEMNGPDKTRAHAIVVTCIVAPLVSSLFVLIRIWTRFFVTHSVGRDDYMAMFTFFFCVVVSITEGIATKDGMGWHERDMTQEILVRYNRWIFICTLPYVCSLFGYKQTILLLYLRIFGVNRIFTRCTWVVMFIVFGYLFCDFWTQLFGCIPPAKFWNPDLPGHCFNFRAVDLAYSFINIISDFLIMLLPLPMIWRLQLKWKGKVGISLVFLSGAIACAVATVRVTYVIRDLYSADRSWDAGRSFLWSILEINTGLICSCMPAFKSFSKHLLSRPFFQRHSTRFWPTQSLRSHSPAAEGELAAMDQELGV